MSGDAPGRDDVPTLIAVGALVAIAASLAHEAFGHGLGCLADGGTITLLSFLLFRCAGAGVLADGGGPIGALLVALICLAAIRIARPKPSALSLFVFALGAETLLWACGQMVSESLDGRDDWDHVARGLGWPVAWHAVLLAVGVAGYGAGIRIAAILGRSLAAGRPRRLLIPYLSTAGSAIILGALWHGDRAGQALDAFLSFTIAPLGYLLAIRAIARAAPAAGIIARHNGGLLGAGALCLLFALTIARGVGRLA